MDGARAGTFIAIEGPDGSGKTTQVARLAEWLRALGLPAITCREPGGTPLGDRLRSLVLDRLGPAIGLRAEMLLYMTSRAQLVDEVIRPAIQSGTVVISDRFLLSNVAYQGYAGGLDVDDVWAVGRVATGDWLPDLTILLDVPPEVAQARIGRPRDRIEDRPEDYRERVRRGFRAAMTDYPRPFLILDGSEEPDRVATRIQFEVARVLGIDPRS